VKEHDMKEQICLEVVCLVVNAIIIDSWGALFSAVSTFQNPFVCSHPFDHSPGLLEEIMWEVGCRTLILWSFKTPRGKWFYSIRMLVKIMSGALCYLYSRSPVKFSLWSLYCKNLNMFLT
jgi:hypothetical protein